jgi:hypothetical protein
MTDLDAELEALFATPPTPPDESFVARVDRAILAEEKMIAAQAAMWRRFAVEFVGNAAVVAAFYLLWKMAPSGIEADLVTTAPAMAAGMVVLLWLGVQLRPALAR